MTDNKSEIYIVKYIKVINNEKFDSILVYITEDYHKAYAIYKETCTNLSIYRNNIKNDLKDNKKIYFVVKLETSKLNTQLVKVSTNNIKESSYNSCYEYQVIDDKWNIDYLN